MSQELLRALRENRVYFESAGLTDDVKAIDKKIAAVEKSIAKAEATEEPAAKKPAAKAKGK